MIQQIVSSEELATLLGLNRRTTSEWIMAGMPATREGKKYAINVAEAMAWVRERDVANALKKHRGGSRVELQDRKLEAEARIAEVEAAKAEGEAVSVSDFQAQMSAMIGAARGKLLPLGAMLGPQVAISDDPNECKNLIDAAVHEALLELSVERVQDIFEGPDGDASGEPESGEPVGTTT